MTKEKITNYSKANKLVDKVMGIIKTLMKQPLKVLRFNIHETKDLNAYICHKKYYNLNLKKM